VGSFTCCHAVFEVLAWRDRYHLSFTGIPNYIVHLVSIVWGSLVGLFVSSGISEDYLFSIPFLLDHILWHAVHFGEVDHFLPVGEMRNLPFSPLLIPLSIVDDGLKLIVVHEDVDDGLKLLHLFLLISNGVKELFFLFLMLILNIFEFDQVGCIFLFYFLESLTHLIYFFI